MDYLGAVAGACGKCSSNKEALKNRSGACFPRPAWGASPCTPPALARLGILGKGVPLKHWAGGMQPHVGWREPGLVCLSPVWGEDWVLRGSPLAWGGCLGWVPLCLRPLPTRRGSWILHCAGVPLSSLAFHIPQPCSCMCSFALTFIFFKQILAIYLNNWFSSRRTHRVVGDGERGPREAGGGPGVYVYPPVALCLIPATGSD